MKTLNRKIQPNIGVVNNIDLLNYEISTLDNGIKVYQINAGDKELVKIEFLFDAGNWFEDKHLISKFTNKMLKEGTKNLISSEIASAIDFYGAHLHTSTGKDHATLTLYSLNKHLGSIIPVFAEIIQQPTFPENELSTLIQNQKQKFIVNNEKVKFIARRKFNEIVFGKEHPYGRLFQANNFDNITVDDLVNYHENKYTADNCKIMVSGKIPQNLINLLNQYFGTLKENSQHTLEEFHSKIVTKDKKVHVNKKNTIQSAIRIGKVLFNKTHDDYLKLKVLNMVLGGYFGSRLMNNIREDKGYTYGIGSGIVSLYKSGYFFITSEVGSDVTQKAINEVYHEIEILQNELVPIEELKLVKNYMLGSFLRSMDGAFAMSENLRAIVEYDLDNSYFESFIRTIKNIKPEELRDLAQRYLQIDSLFELRVGQ